VLKRIYGALFYEMIWRSQRGVFRRIDRSAFYNFLQLLFVLLNDISALI